MKKQQMSSRLTAKKFKRAADLLIEANAQVKKYKKRSKKNMSSISDPQYSVKVYPSKDIWIAEVPILDIMTQGANMSEALMMLKDAVELLVNQSNFEAKIEISLRSNNMDALYQLKNQRMKSNNS